MRTCWGGFPVVSALRRQRREDWVQTSLYSETVFKTTCGGTSWLCTNCMRFGVCGQGIDGDDGSVGGALAALAKDQDSISSTHMVATVLLLQLQGI